MNERFHSSIANDINAFLAFKRALGHPYCRAEFTLQNFDRFIIEHGGKPLQKLDRLILDWLASFSGRKPVTVANELGVLRQFCLFLRRRDPEIIVPGRVWAPQSTESEFLPYIFSLEEIHVLLNLTETLRGAPFRPLLIRSLLLALYCTGLRFGEALRLKQRDVDLQEDMFFIENSKGKSRWVPFGDDLAAELKRYVVARNALFPGAQELSFFTHENGRALSVHTAYVTLAGFFRKAGLKPKQGRIGPRPYDLRHTFAVHRLTRWYHDGVDIQAHLPWLSAYMGHQDLLGTEVYLTATPELLAIAAQRFEARFMRTQYDENSQAT